MEKSAISQEVQCFVVVFFVIKFVCIDIAMCDLVFEPLREKTSFLHMRKQRRRSASR